MHWARWLQLQSTSVESAEEHAKALITRLMFSGTVKQWQKDNGVRSQPPEFVLALARQVHSEFASLEQQPGWEEYRRVAQALHDGRNSERSARAWFLQHQESTVCRLLVKALQQKGFQPTTVAHDAVYVYDDGTVDDIDVTAALVNFVNPPFANASTWLEKAAAEAQHLKKSIVLVPFRPGTLYMCYSLRHAASVCVISKPIDFERPDGTRFARALPTPVCLVRFGANLAPMGCLCVPNTFLLRIAHDIATVERVSELVQSATGEACSVVTSPIAGAARHYASSHRRCAVFCPARVANQEVQQLIRSASSIMFLSPPLRAQSVQPSRRCVEGSLLAFLSKGTGFMPGNSQPVPIPLFFLHPDDG